MMPEVKSSSEVYCETSTPIFKTGIPVSGMAGDQQAALFGQLCTDIGMIKNDLRNRMLYDSEYWKQACFI